MLNNVCLRFDTPQNTLELCDYRGDLHFLFEFIPHNHTPESLWDYLEYNLPNITIVYANGVLFGCFLMQVYHKSVELHGVVRPDVREWVPRHRKVKNDVYNIIFDVVFNQMNREKMIIKAPESNRDVFGFAMAHGFKRLQYKDRGEVVWVLQRETYLGGTKNV